MQKLCCVHTRQQFSASLVYFVTSSPPYLHQFSTISWELYHYNKVMEAANTLVNMVSTTAATNTNLGLADKELLCWHNRLGHIGMRKVQFLMRTGVLATSKATWRLHAAACKLTNLPLCSACQFGKQRRRPEPGKTTTIVRKRDGALKDQRLLPGQTVSVDHFICSTKGRLFTSRGHSKDADMYTGGAIYVDMATDLVHVEFQRHLNTHETLAATAEFERMCLDAGVIPQEYLLDNGSAFTSKEYMAHLRQFSQISRFTGVGAHHHNGVAERAIQTIMSIARTMMLHAAIHWPDMADPSLWPMAVQHAVFLHNHVPSPSTGLCPHDLFFKTRWSQTKFHDLHVWRCPVYVLDKTLSDGKKLPCWMPRSHCEVFMGLSPKHSSTVPWCSTREQVPSHPSTMWCSTTNLPPSVPTKTPCPTSTPTCGPSSLVTVPSSSSSMTNLRRILLTSPMKRTPTPPPSTTIDAQPS